MCSSEVRAARAAPASSYAQRGGRGRLDWNAYGCAQAAKRAVAERDVATVRSGNFARDCESQSGAPLVLVARIVKPQKRLEHFFAHPGRNTRPVVVNGHRQVAMVTMAGDRNRGCKTCGVRHQISKTTLKRGRPNCDDRWSVKHDAGRMAVAFGIQS